MSPFLKERVQRNQKTRDKSGVHYAILDGVRKMADKNGIFTRLNFTCGLLELTQGWKLPAATVVIIYPGYITHLEVELKKFKSAPNDKFITRALNSLNARIEHGECTFEDNRIYYNLSRTLMFSYSDRDIDKLILFLFETYLKECSVLKELSSELFRDM